jgi:hypothetical protein
MNYVVRVRNIYTLPAWVDRYATPEEIEVFNAQQGPAFFEAVAAGNASAARCWCKEVRLNDDLYFSVDFIEG